MDIILGVLDCTLESVSIARRMDGFCKETGLKDFWLVLNKIESEETESILMDKLADLQSKVIGSISYDQELIKTGLSGNALAECEALEDVERIAAQLEQAVASKGRNKMKKGLVPQM
jgi:CO dehydrogenase maturation factor